MRHLLVVDRDSKEVRCWVAGDSGLVESVVGSDDWHPVAGLAVRLRGGGGRLEVDLDGQLISI